MLNTQMFEISHDYCMLLKRGISNLDVTMLRREKKKSIDCNVIKGKTITKSNFLRQGRINSMKTKINNFLFMSFLGYITNAGRNVCNGTHPMLTIPSQAVTLKLDLSYILHKCCQYSKSVLG